MGRFTCLLAALLMLAAAACAQDTTATDPAAGLRGLLRHYTLGAHATRAGDHAAAFAHYRRGLESEPTSPHLRLSAAGAAAALGDTAACLRELTRFTALGASYDLTTLEAVAPLLDLPAFAAVVAANEANGATPPPATVTAVLAGPDLWTEGIACDRATGDLFAGSVRHGKLVRVRGGTQEDLGTSAADGLLEVIGLDIDEERRRIWAVTGRDEAEPGAPHDFGEAPRANAVVAYDLVNGARVVHHLQPADPEGPIHMWNDVSVAPDGTAYLTDMTTTEVLRVPPDGEPELFRAPETVNHINGLVVSDDGARLYVVGLEGIAVIDLPDGRERRLSGPDDLCLGLGDGLALDGRHLFVVQNNGLLSLRILHVLLADDGYGVEAWEGLGCGLPAGLMPYTCAAGEGVVHVNGTAPFARYDDPEPPPAPVIVALPYGLR